MSNPRPETVLVVDDDGDLRDTYRVILERAGFAVEEAGSGAEALRLVAQGPDLVLLDINLLDMDGYEVCRRIKKDPATATIPVLHMSGMYLTSEDRARGLDAGSDGYLNRPIATRELVATINALLRTRRSEAALRRSERRRAAAEAVVEVGSLLLAQSNDLATVARRIAEKLRTLLGASASAVFRLEPGSESLTPLAFSGDVDSDLPPLPMFPVGVGSSGLAVRERKVVVSPNVLHDSRISLTPELRAWVERGPYRATLVVPLIFQDRVIGALLAGDREGRVFTEEEIALGQGFADQAALVLDHFALLKRLQDAAALEERVRLARDLHDGVLQTLAGTIYQMEALRRQLPEDSEARARVLEIQLLMVGQQQELRRMIRPLKGTDVGMPVDESALIARIKEVTERIERQWAQRIELVTEAWRGAVPEPIARQIQHLVSEALANAARHADASLVRVVVRPEGGGARITVSDNGRGFPFYGNYDLKALDAMNLGPVTLRHRLRSLGGDLTIESTTSGSRLEMFLPVPGAGGPPYKFWEGRPENL